MHTDKLSCHWYAPKKKWSTKIKTQMISKWSYDLNVKIILKQKSNMHINVGLTNVTYTKYSPPRKQNANIGPSPKYNWTTHPADMCRHDNSKHRTSQRTIPAPSQWSRESSRINQSFKSQSGRISTTIGWVVTKIRYGPTQSSDSARGKPGLILTLFLIIAT